MLKEQPHSLALTLQASTDSINSAEPENIETVESMLIDISTLRAATGSFAESNKLGEGGFGSVYKVLMAIGIVFFARDYLKIFKPAIGLISIGNSTGWLSNSGEEALQEFDARDWGADE
jgi:hypothetical protein